MKKALLLIALLFGFTLAGLRGVRADACDVCALQGEQIFTACTFQGGSYADCHAMSMAVQCVCYTTQGCGDGIILACGGGQ